MKQDLLQLLHDYPQYAFVISIVINIIIAVLGVVPSVFLTAVNIIFFGFWQGTFISFVGEAVGAFVAFILYRFGFKRGVQHTLEKYKSVKKLLQAKHAKAFYLIVTLRLIPFVPSGLITFAAAIGTVDILTFFVASSLGKIPALLIEAYAAYEVTAFQWQGKLILFIVGIASAYYIVKKMK